MPMVRADAPAGERRAVGAVMLATVMARTRAGTSLAATAASGRRPRSRGPPRRPVRGRTPPGEGACRRFRDAATTATLLLGAWQRRLSRRGDRRRSARPVGVCSGPQYPRTGGPRTGASAPYGCQAVAVVSALFTLAGQC
ncbi:MAG: hypothetical protein AVDCRST_MAG49-3551 [uncultured Thermomicrobiales bacterium]|uniref:Uncharacterized protein n=1 Tax=uncultured Thermomicrobiales bacterium TaxID=1645740 RepID=A0A6J4VB31_9BACT|nr:MAG: hypothetical protein AVDCRST_MAG49-3551 [uncultured Thermomicrobiales bacterium]